MAIESQWNHWIVIYSHSAHPPVREGAFGGRLYKVYTLINPRTKQEVQIKMSPRHIVFDKDSIRQLAKKTPNVRDDYVLAVKSDIDNYSLITGNPGDEDAIYFSRRRKAYWTPMGGII